MTENEIQLRDEVIVRDPRTNEEVMAIVTALPDAYHSKFRLVLRTGEIWDMPPEHVRKSR